MPRMLHLLACVSTAGALACAGNTTAEFDPTHDFHRDVSWEWMPEDGSAPELARDPVLHALLRASIERELTARGLRHTSDQPDLRVTYRLDLVRDVVLRTETPAEQHLPSLHGTSPSYDVVASRQRPVFYERVALSIEMSDARARQVVWRGRIEERVRGRFADQADDAVAEILAAYPPAP